MELNSMNKLPHILNNDLDIECKYIADNYSPIKKKYAINLTRTLPIKSVGYNETQMLDVQVTYGSTEFMLKLKGFNVKHLIRDYRGDWGDWGDDGGWIIAISSKNNKWYAHIIEINYNYELSDVVFDNDIVHIDNDFIMFDTYNESIEYIKTFTNKLSNDMLSTLRDELDYYNGEDDHIEMREILSDYDNLTNDELWWLGVIFASTSCSLELDICRMKHIDTLKYTENFLMLGEDEVDSMLFYKDKDLYFKAI